ncbi:MAG: MBL fold metallo-hydrolase [Acidobacteriota bacterium]
MTNITEIAADIFRINTFIPEANLGFSQFLVRDDEPLLFHTGMKALFPVVREAVATLIDPASLRWIGFSHFEADECGSLNEWQIVAPEATPVCSFVGKIVSVDDFAPKNPAKGMADGETFQTGTKRYRFIATPHVPHCWEAGMLFEESTGVLFCTDLLHQNGDVEPSTTSDVIGRARETFVEYQAGPLANYFPYTQKTDGELKRLAALKPRVLATMHGSVFQGDGERALLDYSGMVREVLG